MKKNIYILLEKEQCSIKSNAKVGNITLYNKYNKRKQLNISLHNCNITIAITPKLILVYSIFSLKYKKIF